MLPNYVIYQIEIGSYVKDDLLTFKLREDSALYWVMIHSFVRKIKGERDGNKIVHAWIVWRTLCRGLVDDPYRDKSPITMRNEARGGNESDATVATG